MWINLCIVLRLRRGASLHAHALPSQLHAHACSRAVASGAAQRATHRARCIARAQVASPVENYFLEVDDLDESEQKAAITALTQPVLDALDEEYATP